MPYDIKLPDGTLVNNIPDDIDPVAAKAKLLEAYPDLALNEKRTWGEAATDIGASFGKGIGTLAQIPGQIYGLATGDVQPNEGLQGLGKKFEAYSESFKSPVLKAKEAERQKKISQAEGFFNEAGVAIGQTIKDPALITSFFAEQIPNLFGAGGGGIITKTGAKLLFREAGESALSKAGVYGARASEAAMQGADIGSDTYEKVYDARIKQGAKPEEAQKDALLAGRTAAIEAGAITFGTSWGAGSTIERALTRGMAGVPKTGIIRGTLGELASEGAEEGGGQLVSNLQMQKVVPETDIMKGVGAAAGLGAMGGALFGLPASFVNKANAAELERAKQMVEDAKKRAAENNRPEEIQLQIGYDPKVEGSGIYTPIIVNPDGSTTFPGEKNQFAQVVPNELSESGMAEKYGIPTAEQLGERTFTADTIKSFGISPKANIYKKADVLGSDIADPAQAAKVKAELESYLKKYPNANPKIRKNIQDYLARPEFQLKPVAPTQITEASTTAQADQDAVKQRLIEGFKNRPEIKKIYEEYDKMMAAKDADKAAMSAFNNVVTPETLKGLGFHSTSPLFNDASVVNADLTNPDTADQIRDKLLAMQAQTKSKIIKDNIEKYLNRSEFITPKFVDQYLNPPRTENEQGLDHFVFTDAEGNIQSKYGTIYEKNGKKYVRYPENKAQKGGERELNENVAVNPNPDQIELMSLYKAKENLMKEPDDFKAWLMSYGVNSKERKDMGVENRVPHRMFRDDGWGIDALALAAINDGIMTEGDFDMNTTNGGVEQMKEYIKRSMYGEFVPTLNNTRNMMDIENIQSRIDNLEDRITGVPEEVIAEQVTEENPDARMEISKTPYADKFIQDSKKLTKDIRAALDKMGLKDVGVKFEDAMRRRINGEMTAINGEYFDKMIELSLSGDNISRTMNHEALHAMKDLGFFTASEWKTLENKARSEWMDKYKISDSYSKESEEIQLEEAIAHAFADMQTQPAPIKSLMSRVVNFLKRVGNWFRGNGYKTAEDIFAKAAAGELKATNIQETNKEPKFEKTLKASFEGVNPDYAEAIRKQFTQEQATVGEKFNNLKSNFFEKMVTGMFDEFRVIKKYTTEGYMMARLSKSIDGGLQGLLEHGQVYLKDGALDIRPNTKGLLEILAPLGTEVDQYQIWKALNRDAQMPADKRSFKDELINGRNELTNGTIDGKSRKETYEKAREEESKLNKSVLDVALESGLIDKQAYQVFSNDINYIPFYKMMEDGDVNSVNASSKLTGQYFSKALKGGEKKTNDLMENVLLNWSHILSASMKNQAAFKTVQAAESMGAAERAKPMDGKYPPNTIKVMENGKTTHFTLSDPDLVDAISTISYLGPKSAFLDVAKGFTNALRYGVTLSPAYKVRNLIRDSLQSAAVSELGANMFENVYNGLAMTKKGDPTFMSALAGGGIFEMGTAHEGNQAKLIKRLIDKGIKETSILDTPEKIKGKLQDLLDSYNELGNKFENANRLALYKKLRESGKSHLEASYAARDLMDFSMQGQFRAVKVIASCVPFFNARLQGLYKLGRDGITPTYRVICNATTGKPLQIGDKEKAQRFMVMSSAIALASMALYGMYKDDEDFQRREDWDRDNFWWFKIGETQFRIPKPFEIGAFGTVAERTYEQIVDENVEGKVFGQRMNSILMDTFSLNPMPQMMKPLIDLYANKDSFTGAPIESAGMERLSKQERVNDKTSGVAIALGGISAGASKILTFNPDAQGISPVQMDYAIKAYLGWLGATAVATADRAVEPFQEGTKVHPPVIDTLALGFIKTEPQTQSKYMTQFYQNNARLQSALSDMRHYAELGEMDKVTQILEEKGDDIALSKVYDKTTKQLAELRKQSRRIEQDKNMDADDKRAEMNRLKILMSDMAKQMEQIRKTK